MIRTALKVFTILLLGTLAPLLRPLPVDEAAYRGSILQPRYMDPATGEPLQEPVYTSTIQRLALQSADPGSRHILVINLAARASYLFDASGCLERTWKIAPGQVGYPTPTGVYSMMEIEHDPTWYIPASKWAEKYRAKYGRILKHNTPLGAVKIRLTRDGLLIHGTTNPASVTNQSLISHACIRMFNEDVQELADSAEIDMPVIIVNRAAVVAMGEDGGIYAWIFRDGYGKSAPLDEVLLDELDSLGFNRVDFECLRCAVSEAVERFRTNPREWCQYTRLD